MSLDLTATRTALELPDAGLNVYESISGAQSLPFAVLGNVEKIEYSKSYGGLAKVQIPLWVMVDRADDTSAQRALDRACSIGSEGSVYDAIRALAETDGKPWRSFTCLGTGPYGTSTFNNQPTLGVAFNLTITA